MAVGLRTTLLIVEDEKLAAMLLEDAFLDAGFEVLVAATAQEGRQLAVANWDRLAAMTLDLNLCGESGATLGIYLRSIGFTLPIIVVSGYGHEGLPPPEILKVEACLAKPCDPDEVLYHVRLHIAAWQRAEVTRQAVADRGRTRRKRTR